jgi:predicted nucleic acid-binding protein
LSSKKAVEEEQQKTVFVDTTIIVNVDRGRKDAIELCKRLTSTNSGLISTVTVSEILTGSYLRTDYKVAVKKAEEVLGQFTWVPLNGDVAKLVAELNAYLISEGLPVEYQDVVIAASCLSQNCEVLLTENKDHFMRFPKLKSKVMTVGELSRKL